VGAGYSAGGALSAMRRLRELEPETGAPADSPVQELAGVPLQALQEYFRSHPPVSERIAAFEKQIADRKWNSDLPQRPLAIRAIFRTEQAAAQDAQGEFQKAVARYREAIQDDPNYQPAHRGLIRALWRSGDAAATIAAAEQAFSVSPDHDDVEDWHILALAEAANSCSAASERFKQLESTYPPGADFASTAARIDGDGLAIFCIAQADRGLSDYINSFALISGVEQEARARILMAGWMYRAGRLDEALREIETAFQRSPATLSSNPLRAWTLTDLGRQADALNALSGTGVDNAEKHAALAVIHWRTEERDVAKHEFMQAVEYDPVWMEPHWARNNYSAMASGVISELRASEVARRKEEEAKKRRAAAIGEANPR
jgi:tetratricopeptide (TPR) repeat protein